MAGDSDVPENNLFCVNCAKPANLQCPKCMNLKLPRAGSAFCSQECFKSSWSSHKSVHLKAKLSSPDTQNSGSLSEGWLYCLKSGQAWTPKLPYFDWTGSLRPSPISKKQIVPDHIDKPDWADDGIPKIEPNSVLQYTVEVKTPYQIERMRETCHIAREVLDAAARIIQPGVTTDEIDRVVHETTIAAGGYPSPLNYNFFPKSCCTSVNEVICHGIPDARKLEDGDIVNVDVSVYYKGVHADLNETYFVGNVDEESCQLVKCTYECLEKAISIVKPGVRFREIGEVISRHASMSGFSVARSYCGHGIGELFHCAPNIPHYARNKAVGVIKAGQTFTIEPMINAGVWRDRMWPDGWTDVTTDGKRSAQFEHTLLVTDTGVEVLTGRLQTSPNVFPWLNS
ncbi:methionine aminopeptidase 1A isoform X1 [Vigna radiata var. radiata]|uniref:Methionine aminopeptidase n=1 Tax=Vigna radiata var. radiata TaxID=3916 RepID=A0A1S3VC28_VIGRR|nr:methionine aminopeptidase 1A isoform X1 [Vigna radiata var. radiata]